MRVINIDVGNSMAELIYLGNSMEHKATKIIFDVSSFAEMYGEGEVELVNCRPGEKCAYPVPLKRTGNWAEWLVERCDTEKSGRGKCELRYRFGLESEGLSKSNVFATIVADGISDGKDPPEGYKDWIDNFFEEYNKIMNSEGIDAAVKEYLKDHPVEFDIEEWLREKGIDLVAIETRISNVENEVGDASILLSLI